MGSLNQLTTGTWRCKTGDLNATVRPYRMKHNERTRTRKMQIVNEMILKTASQDIGEKGIVRENEGKRMRWKNRKDKTG